MGKKEEGKEEEMDAIWLSKRLRGRQQLECPLCGRVSLCITIKELKECPYCGQKLRISEKKLRERRNKK